MKTFRTEISLSASNSFITYQDKIACIGSCFAQNIGCNFKERKFQTLINPFGVVFNPISLANVVLKILNDHQFIESDVDENKGVYFSYSHHSQFDTDDKQKCLNGLNKSVSDNSSFVKAANWLFITLGTAWVYENKAKNQIVANCHKVPNKEFDKRLLSVEEIVQSQMKLLNQLWINNPNLNVVYTVSPVRHLKDGVVENQRSKSTLHMAVHELQAEFKSLKYFPAYEIMMDDLRDYRFYKSDMLHPSNEAIEYIWEKLKDWIVQIDTVHIIKKIEQIMEAKMHQPFNRNSPKHQKFLINQLETIKELQFQNPQLNFADDANHFENQLIQI